MTRRVAQFVTAIQLSPVPARMVGPAANEDSEGSWAVQVKFLPTAFNADVADSKGQGPIEVYQNFLKAIVDQNGDAFLSLLHGGQKTLATEKGLEASLWLANMMLCDFEITRGSELVCGDTARVSLAIKNTDSGEHSDVRDIRLAKESGEWKVVLMGCD